MFDIVSAQETTPSGYSETAPEAHTGTLLSRELSRIPPGAELGSLLESLDRERLPGHEQVVVMQAWSRQVAHAQAELYLSMTSVAGAVAEIAAPDDDVIEIYDVASSEIRAALAWTRRAAEFHLSFAQDLIEKLPRVWVALHDGMIDLPKARVILKQICHLDQDTAREVAKQALERADRETTGQLRARIQRLVIAVDPDSARHRYEQGMKERRVIAEPTESGTANLFGLDLPAASTSAAMRRINRLARAAKTANDSRTMDQIRADVFLDLLTGRSADHSRGDGAVVNVEVDLTTLAELNDNPAQIPGWGPVISDIARQVAREQDAEWRVTVTDPDTGAAVHSGTTRRRPTADQKRLVEFRNPTCIFPGCRMPAADSDLDHRHAWSEGGSTHEENLNPLCRHDHLLKHHGWGSDNSTRGSTCGSAHSGTAT